MPMRRQIVVSVTALVAVALSLAAPVRADRLLAGGEALDCPTAIVEVNDELLAPLLPAVKSLGGHAIARGDRVTVIGPRGQRIVFTENQAKAEVGAATSDLAAAPRRVKEVWLLPMRSLASLLGWTVRWDPDKRQAELLLQVTSVTVSDKKDGWLRVTIAATGAVKSRNHLGSQEDPDRLLVDISGADISVPNGQARQVVGSPQISEISVAPTTANPAGVRVTIQTPGPPRYYLSSGDNGCTLYMDVAEGRVRLSDMKVDVRSAGFAQVTLTTSRPARTRVLPLDRGGGYGDRLLVFIEDAEPAIPEPPTVPKESPLKGIRFTEETKEHPFGVILDLKERAGHAVATEGNQVVIYVGTPRLQDLCVVIDPGHGGIFPGAQYGGLCEKDLNLDIAQRLAKALRDQGVEVCLTRDRDQETIPGCGRGDLRAELAARTALPNKVCADLFISIHCNACATPNGRGGTEVYYHYARPQERGLADALDRAMGSLGVGGAGVRPDNAVYNSGLFVLRNSPVPAALVEVAYLNNDADRKLLASASFRQKAAESIRDGLKSYVEGGEFYALYRPERRSAREAKAERDRAAKPAADPAGDD
jgi:N-acetylmuramoyl-L-alanine amidase